MKEQDFSLATVKFEIYRKFYIRIPLSPASTKKCLGHFFEALFQELAPDYGVNFLNFHLQLKKKVQGGLTLYGHKGNALGSNTFFWGGGAWPIFQAKLNRAKIATKIAFARGPEGVSVRP